MGVHDLQQGFFDVARVRRGDPETSFAAARSVTEEKLTQTQEWVLHAFSVGGALTDEELIEMFRSRWSSCKASPQSIRSRRAELRRKGLIVDSRERRLTQYGQRSQRFGGSLVARDRSGTVRETHPAIRPQPRWLIKSYCRLKRIGARYTHGRRTISVGRGPGGPRPTTKSPASCRLSGETSPIQGATTAVRKGVGRCPGTRRMWGSPPVVRFGAPLLVFACQAHTGR
jgi:hypothetical protein